jgi:predicted porin
LQRNQSTRINNAMMYSTPAMGGFSASLMYGTGDVSTAGTVTAASVGLLMASTGGADNTAGNLNKNVGRHVGLNLRYANGPVAVAYGYGKTDTAATTAAGGATLALIGVGTPAQLKQNTLTGSYDFGVAKLFANWSTNQNDVETAKTVDNRTWSLGLTAPVGPGVVRVQFGQTDNKLVADTDSKLAAVGYVYPLSKRTTLYTTYAKVSNKNNGTFSYLGDGSSSTSSVGVVGNGATAAGASNVGPSTLQLGVSHSF